MIDLSENKEIRDNRIPLKTNNKIKLRHMSSGGIETFTIKSLIGAGGASLVYSATRNNRKGILKEFYPQDFIEKFHNLKRTEKHQLVATSTAYIDKFTTMCEEFKHGYDFLEKVNFSSMNNPLSNYIPDYELYLGTDENSTVYVWTKQTSGITLEDYITNIWTNPNVQTEFKLFNLLTIIKSIALGVCAMHIQGLTHRDIKPSNFLIAKDGLNNINPYQVSMFDINSFCRSSSSENIVAGTPGYMAPEAYKGQARFYSDIYSLGAVIYTALVDNKKTFINTDYKNLDDLVEESELLSNVTDIYIKAHVLNILKKSLAKLHSQRYETTEQLIDDIDKVIVRFLPYTEAKKMTNSNQRLKIIEESKPIDAIPVFQNLLYKHPVFNWYEDKNEINVLVLGCGMYGQAFIDVALSTLQVEDKPLNLTVLTESPEYDKAIYLQARPDLERFFDIDTTVSDNTSYGKISFIKGKFVNKQQDNELIKDIISRTNPCYVLVALGNDELNNTIAKKIVDTKIPALVNFVWAGAEKKFTKGNPVYISQKIGYDDIDRDLTRMAFNAHLIWEDSVDADIDTLYADFRKPYNFKSSIAFALSIPYKLNSMELTMEEIEMDLSKAKIEQQEVLQTFSWIEHRRWVTEKITSGWRAPLKENGELNTNICIEFNDNKSKKKKLHLCIVKSEQKTCPPKKQWDICNLDELDPLDRMSVETYRHFKKASDDFKKHYYLEVCKQIEEIRSSLPHSNGKLIKLFNEYDLALSSILEDTNSAYTKKFDAIADALQKEIQAADLTEEKKILFVLDEIASKLKSTICANKKTDYKAIDVDLVSNIPFIVGNHPRPKLALIFNDGRFDGYSNNSLFKNIASGMIIIPKTIKYMYYYNVDTKLPQLLSAINGVLDFFVAKNMKHHTEFLFVFEKEIDSKIKATLNNISESRGVKITLLENVHTPAEATQHFLKSCKDEYLIDGTSLPFTTATDNALYTEEMRKLPYFEYSINENKFINSTCQYLNYLDTSKCKLIISDLFILKCSKYSFSTPDVGMFYQKLWDIYTGKSFNNPRWDYGTRNWNSLSKKLNEYSAVNDVIMTLTYNDCNNNQTRTFEKIMPMSCYSSCEMIIQELVKEKILKSGCTTALNEDSFRISINHYENDKDLLALFSKYDLLSKKLRVETYYDYSGKKVKISHKSLSVENITLNRYEKTCIDQLAKAKFINDLKSYKPDGCSEEKPEFKVSFHYCSESIKQILEVAGSILEIYTYYSLLASGAYDDVQINVLVDGGGFNNEFDIILGKNNKFVFIECKAQNEIKQDFYHKINSLAKYYGINSTPMLISNDCIVNDITGNKTQNIKRGDSLGVFTVSEPEDIQNINNILLNLFD